MAPAVTRTGKETDARAVLFEIVIPLAKAREGTVSEVNPTTIRFRLPADESKGTLNKAKLVKL